MEWTIMIFKQILPILLCVGICLLALSLTNFSHAQNETDFQLINCEPIQVAIFVDRAHVLCEQGIGDIVFFAVPTSDVERIDWYLTIIMDAMNSDKRLVVYTDLNDLGGNSFGCQILDCRIIFGLILNQ